jgi:hypothetical protein
MMPSFDGLLFRLRTSERLELQTHPPPSTHTHDAARADTWYTSYRYCLYFLNKRYRICQTRGKIRELVLYYYYYGNAPSRTGVPMRFDSNPLLDLLARSSFGRRSTERLSDTQLARNVDLVQSIRWKRVPDGAGRWAWAGRAGCLPSPPIKLALVGKQRLRSFHANQPVRVRDPGQQRPAPPPLEASVFHLVVRAIPCSHLPLTSPVHSSRFASGKTRTVSSSVPIHTIIPT